MPTSTKPFSVLKNEGKSHRTKAEMKLREDGEKATITGTPMEAWKSLDRKAKKEFNRVKELLGLIDKDDALYESIINRYCELKSECEKYKEIIDRLINDIENIENVYAKGDIDFIVCMDKKSKINTNMMSVDRQLQNKRKMMLDIEKESIMTIASALRSIPKKVEDDSDNSEMAKMIAAKRGT